MRMTAIVNRFAPAWRRRLATLGMLVTVLFAAILLPQAQAYVGAQYAIITPNMQVHDSYRVLAMVVGLALICAFALLRLASESSWADALGAGAAAAAIGGAFWFLRPEFAALGNATLIVFFAGLVGACVLLGVPIAISFGISTLAYLTFATHVPLGVIVSQMDQGMSSLELLAVPLFVLLGLLLEMTGIAAAIVDFFAALVGHLRGGLSYVLFGAMFLISGISGSKAADQAAVAPILFPEMKQRGAHPGELVAQLASAGAMSETIPPSLVLIIIGSVTGVSISALFTGGLIPAAVAAIALLIVTYFRSGSELERRPRADARTIGRAFIYGLPGLILPFVIRTAVLAGVATATEVSTVGVVYCAIVGIIIYRKFQWRRLVPILIETASLSGAILFIIGAATAMAWALTQAGFAQQLASAIEAAPGGRSGFLAISIVVFIVLGSILEGIPAIVLFGPLLFPIARAVGVNDVQYTMVVILAMGIGLFAPPFGVGFYQSCLIGRADSDEAIGRIFPYLAAVFVALVLVAAIPWLSIGLLAAHR
jgi:tripartite ATP-independent transporter DctM subunit